MADRPPPVSIAVRQSHQLRVSEVLLLGIGLWLAVGIFGLFDPVMSLSGQGAGIAYLFVGLLLVPTILSHVELRSWIRHGSGSYQLIQVIERPGMTFFAGWTYLLGWAALSALVGLAFASWAGQLIEWFFPSVVLNRFIFLGALVFFFIVSNALGYRPPWRLSVWLLGAAIVSVVLLALTFVIRMLGPTDQVISGVGGSSGSFFQAIAALVAAMWVIEFITERRRRGGVLPFKLIGLLGGPILAGALALFGWTAMPSGPSLLALVDWALPGFGRPVLLGLGVIASGVAWQILALNMLRQFQVIGNDGLLPAWLISARSRFRTPVWLILLQGLLTLGAALGASLPILSGTPEKGLLSLAYAAALAFLILQIGVNITAIMLAQHPRAAQRAFRLPLFPIIPACGIAINFLLALALPPLVFLIGAGWYVLGTLLYWQSGRERMRASQLGVTVFQDTTRRPDITSEYPVLVPIANPDTASGLVAFGASIARQYGGHLVLLHVLRVPEQLPLDSRRFQAKQQLDLLERLLQEAERYGVPVEGVTRLSRSISQGILDTVIEESARLVVMGWHPNPRDSSRYGLGHVLDEVLDNATCDVAIVRGEKDGRPERVLVPVSGGPHAPHAAVLGLALTSWSGGEVTLLHVTRSSEGEEGFQSGLELVKQTRESLGDERERVTTRVVAASSPLEGILEAAKGQDMILLGVSDPDFLNRQGLGQIPAQIASQTDKPVLLMHSYAGLTSYVARKAWHSLSGLLPTLSAQEQVAVYRRMQQAARPNINYYVLITLSAVIATLGLLLNSPAVVIGAMLVAPLMSPMVAIAVGITFGDIRTLRNALTATVQGILAAIFIGILITAILPISDPSSEVLARTRPNLMDLLVALASGMAGAYAIARKEVGEALPGVAIAAALVPPLGTVGIGIALGDPAIAGGSLLLFTTNLVAIVFSAALVFLLLGIRPPQQMERRRWLRRGLLISIVSLMVISIPLGFVLWRSVEQDQIEQQARDIVSDTVAGWGDVELVELDVQQRWSEVAITGTLYATSPVTDADMQALEGELDRAIRPRVHVRLFLIEGTILHTDTP